MEQTYVPFFMKSQTHAEVFVVKSLLFRQGVVCLSPGIYKIELDILNDKAIASKIE